MERNKSFTYQGNRGETDGGADQDRTGDLLTASQALSQLSYSPTMRAALLQERALASRLRMENTPTR